MFRYHKTFGKIVGAGVAFWLLGSVMSSGSDAPAKPSDPLRIELNRPTIARGLAEQYAKNPEMRRSMLELCQQMQRSGRPMPDDLHCRAAGAPAILNF